MTEGYSQMDRMVMALIVVVSSIFLSMVMYRIISSKFFIGFLFGVGFILLSLAVTFHMYDRYLQGILASQWEQVERAAESFSEEKASFTASESSHWLNNVIFPFFIETTKKFADENIQTIVMEALDRFDYKRPDFVDKFRLSDEIINPKDLSVREVRSRPMAYDMAECLFLFDFQGEVALQLSSNIRINYPYPNFMIVPIKASIFLTEVSGKVLLRTDRKNGLLALSFTEYPENNLRIVTDVGGYVVLSNIASIENFLKFVIKARVSSMLLHPNRIEVNMKEILPDLMELFKEESVSEIRDLEENESFGAVHRTHGVHGQKPLDNIE